MDAGFRPALDVYDEEPLPPDYPIRGAPRLLHTRHVGFVSADGYRAYYQVTLDNVLAFIAGKPINVIS